MTTLNLNTNVVLSLLDNQPDSVFYFVPVYAADNNKEIVDFKLAYCNKHAALMANVSTETLIGQNVLTLINSNNLFYGIKLDELSQVYQTEKPFEASFLNPALNKHFQLWCTRVEEGVLTITRNTTNEVKVQEEQQRQVELTDSILDASINGVLALEAVRNENNEIVDFEFVKANDKVELLLGKKEKELIGKSYLSMLAPSKENGMFDLKAGVVETGVPVRMEFYYKGVGIDGWFDISISKLGKSGVVETFTDITERKLDKDRLEQSAQRFETVVNTSKAGMFTLIPVKDEKGEVIDFRFGIVNQAVATYIGQTAEVLMGSLGSTYFPAYMTNGLFTIYKDCYLHNKPYNFDFHYEDGYDVFFQIDVTKMGDEVLVTFTDHTVMKRLQRELEMKIIELGRSNANLEEFANAASHDMKEPLRKIRTFADRLKRSLNPKMDETEKSLFHRIELSTERMQLLLDDLLEFSHVSERPLETELVDLNEKVKKVLTDLELPIEEKHATIIAEALPTINGYRRQLQQLFQNLIGNALKYSKADVAPEVIIRSRIVNGTEVQDKIPVELNDKTFYLIEVSDNGIGFEQQYAEQIFDMFQRLHGKMEYSGTGVGLAIARKVVENHNGFIWATSQPGIGSTFYVLLPA
ncbi:PAS domain-containing sensor histidine kinase [Flavisolibacter tropicus]|uniref:PAS domain-containing sensor histidine kinase n=1 Tax=Flavisolibacter tropicus TaxID=1492898 RepID=UPI00082E5D1E|nr:ATP-binding protein [Flavisolibacter tropicus]